MSAFSDKLFAVTDAGDGATMLVTDESGSTFNVDMGIVDNIINGGIDPSMCFAFNMAARLALNGFTTCRTPDKTAAAPAALALLSSASFKGY